MTKKVGGKKGTAIEEGGDKAFTDCNNGTTKKLLLDLIP
jgi:hypothetical protein